MLAWCSLLDSLQFVMQHDHVLKKLNLNLLTPLPRSGVGGGVGRVCGQNICDHVAAFMIPLSLICNMTMF